MRIDSSCHEMLHQFSKQSCLSVGLWSYSSNSLVLFRNPELAQCTLHIINIKKNLFLSTNLLNHTEWKLTRTPQILKSCDQAREYLLCDKKPIIYGLKHLFCNFVLYYLSCFLFIVSLKLSKIFAFYFFFFVSFINKFYQNFMFKKF